MHRFLFCLSVFLGIIGCNTEEPRPLTDDQLVEVLADVHLAEAAIAALPRREKDTLIDRYYQQIMEIHGVLRADFDSTMVLLKQKPDELSQVYEKVLEEIDKNKTNQKK